MNIPNLQRTMLVTVFGVIASLTTVSALANTPEPSGLFVAPKTNAQAAQKSARKGKFQEVKVDLKKLRQGRIFVKLPDGSSYEAVREMQQDRGKGGLAWVGHASDNPQDSVVLGVSGEAVAGTFTYKGKKFRLEPRANGSQVISEISKNDPAPELDPIPVTNADTASAGGASSDAATAGDSNGSVIDVLVAYTPAVQAVYGAAGAQAMVVQAVAEANQAYANSAMTTRLNLVKSVLTNYTESGDMSTDLSQLRSTSDGKMDELHALRNQYGADVVTLIENEPAYCGLAYRMASLSSSFASSAFNVVHYSCATGYYSLAHEIGHNQGAHHDTVNATGGAAIYPYAYGYQDPNNAFRTVMAYACPGGCSRIPYFSSAQVYYNGRLTGSPNAAENARAIDNTAATVAAFRGAPQLPPTAPANMNSAATGPTQIDVNWQDMSGNESGFLLERSTDGTTFVQIASLAANVTSFHDESLAPDTLYQYRGRSWNSSGNSAYSNLTIAATEAEPAYIDQFALADGNVSGAITGSFQNTLSKDGVKESIKEILSAGTTTTRYSYLEHYWVFSVAPGDSITLYANADTLATSQSFTFAYSTVPGVLKDNPGAWVDMFTVSANTQGEMQFELPASLSGNVYISVRDNTRTPGVKRTDTINVDSLVIRTRGGSGAIAPPVTNPLPPGC